MGLSPRDFMLSPAPQLGLASPPLKRLRAASLANFFCKGHVCDYLDASLTGWRNFDSMFSMTGTHLLHKRLKTRVTSQRQPIRIIFEAWLVCVAKRPIPAIRKLFPAFLRCVDRSHRVSNVVSAFRMTDSFS